MSFVGTWTASSACSFLLGNSILGCCHYYNNLMFLGRPLFCLFVVSLLWHLMLWVNVPEYLESLFAFTGVVLGVGSWAKDKRGKHLWSPVLHRNCTWQLKLLFCFVWMSFAFRRKCLACDSQYSFSLNTLTYISPVLIGSWSKAPFPSPLWKLSLFDLGHSAFLRYKDVPCELPFTWRMLSLDI